MASITRTDIETVRPRVQVVDFRPGPRMASTHSTTASANPDAIVLKQYQPGFLSIIGREPSFSLLLSSADSSKNPFFHNACAYLSSQDELYVTSNLLQSASSSQLPVILISKVSFQRSVAPVIPDVPTVTAPEPIRAAEWMKLRPPSNMPMPAGAIEYQDGVLYCSQGTLDPGTGGLCYMPRGKPPVPILSTFFNRPFNSIHSVALGCDGGLWFTDPCIGFEQEFRPKPQLPNQVYRYDPWSGDVHAVADGFGRPTGIALSFDGETLYVTDTEAVRPDGTTDPTRAATIYAFDVIRRAGSSCLANKRLFAYAIAGVPTAVACDAVGNVYAACADGVEIWSPAGAALGLIEISGGCSSLCFGRWGELFVCADQRLWRVQLEPTITGEPA
ncbi:calcium-dependent phosphotriesterase [Xylariaceae sp. FL0662B]|nr:calcium-dependent phosphotriesterase [Xylariaceae sp. FL0662B]